MVPVGILSVGVYEPELVRTNSWWSAETVQQWQARARQADQSSDPAGAPPEGPVKDAIGALAGDPFNGSVERRIMPAGMRATDMEALAAQRALDAAGLEPSQIDLVLVSAFVPDMLGTNAACTVQHELGVPQASLCMSIDSNFNGFHHQMALAHGLISSGQARYGLLIQSASATRVLAQDQHYSPWFGDGATAVVVGPTEEGYGVLAQAHRSDGSLQQALLVGVPGGEWFEGRSLLYSGRPDRQRRVLAGVCAASRDVISSALAQAKLEAEDVRFYAGHQGTAWYRQVTQENAGLGHALYADSFATNGSMAACNCPFVLSLGLARNQIDRGDIVVTHAGGNGSTWSSLVMRWVG